MDNKIFKVLLNPLKLSRMMESNLTIGGSKMMVSRMNKEFHLVPSAGRITLVSVVLPLTSATHVVERSYEEGLS